MRVLDLRAPIPVSLACDCVIDSDCSNFFIVIHELLISVICLFIMVNHNVLVKYTCNVNQRNVLMYMSLFPNIGVLVFKIGRSVVILPTVLVQGQIHMKSPIRFEIYC